LEFELNLKKALQLYVEELLESLSVASNRRCQFVYLAFHIVGKVATTRGCIPNTLYTAS
jgi:hypothetical protein